MFNVIVAMTKNGGIGITDAPLPWYSPEELKLFKQKTDGCILVMGRITTESIPHLPNREIWCITTQNDLDTSSYKNKVIIYTNMEKVFHDISNSPKPVFFAGGESIYNIIPPDLVNEWHISIMNEDYKCDTFITLPKFPPKNTLITEKKVYPDFTHYVYKRNVQSPEIEYLNILEDVLNHGISRRGRNGETKSAFCKNLHFDLTTHFPLLTTKKMFLRGIVEELLFFLRGDTDTKKLEQKNVNIWKGNTERKFLDSIGFQKRKEGMMGPMYGFQWRHFNGDYNENTGRSRRTVFINGRPPNRGIDQLKDVIDKIRNDPHSRRILMTDYNPEQANKGVLYPCHSIIIQFYVDGDYLDMYCFNRSSDLFLGLPFNIASSALLQIIIAQTTQKIARHFHLTLGDAHIYEQHYNAVKEQLTRVPIQPPTISINHTLQTITDIEGLRYEDFVLKDYACHPSIKASMIA